jgi:hypothetical protein
MANITYTPVFKHEDWIDNEDVVQASGTKGFNKKFHDLEDEFTTLATVVGTVDTEIKKIQRLNFLSAPPSVTLNPGATSTEFQIENYTKASMPANIERVYFAAIYPLNTAVNIQHTFLYRTVAPGTIGVSVVFFNAGTIQAQFNFRVMALATQS